MWCWRRHLRVPARRLQPVHSEGDQPWDFFGGNDAEAENPVLWPPHGKSWLTGKDSDAGRDWVHEKKGTTKDEMAGWHHWLDGRESEWTPGVSDGQGAWRAAIHGVAKSRTRLSDWTELNPLSVALFANILPHSIGCLFILSKVSFSVQKLLSLIWSCLFIFALIYSSLGDWPKKYCYDLCQRVLYLWRTFVVYSHYQHTHTQDQWWNEKKKYMSRQIGYNNFKSTSSQGNTY